MSGKSRSQKVILSVISPRIPHLPAGDYSCYVDDVRIVRGSIRVVTRIVDTIPKYFIGEEEVKGNG